MSAIARPHTNELSTLRAMSRDVGVAILETIDAKIGKGQPTPVEFLDWGISQRYFTYIVNPRKLGQLSFDQLGHQEIIERLEAIIKLPVYVLRSARTGFRYVVEVTSPAAARPLRERVAYDPAQMPAGEMRVAIGEVSGHAGFEPVVLSLAEPHHVLVIGATQYGKTNLMQVLLLSLARKHSPEQVRFVIIDPKSQFYDWNATAYPTLPAAESLEEAEGRIAAVVDEFERRKGLFKSVGAKSLRHYNAIQKSTGGPELAWWVVVVDEFVDLALQDGSAGRRGGFMRLLMRLSSFAASVGIRLVLGTTNPKAEIVDTTLRSACDIRISFYCAESNQYGTLFGPGSGHLRLPAVRGRMLIKTPDRIRPYEAQAYYCNEEIAANLIRERATVYAGVEAAAKAVSFSSAEWHIVQALAGEMKAAPKSKNVYVPETPANFYPVNDLEYTLTGKVSRITIRETGARWEQCGWLGRAPASKSRTVLPLFWTVVEAVFRGEKVTEKGELIE